MSDRTCVHNWCDLGDNHTERDTHETRIVHVNGVPSRVAGEQYVSTQVNYVDGDREPLIYVGAGEVEMTPAQLEQLIAVLREQLLIARSVQPTSALAGARS